MTEEDHGSIEELLAGYALRSLSGPDAGEADRLLTEHVPACPRCRDTLDAFAVVSADLALGADPLAPPETLLPSLHREIARNRNRARTRRATHRISRLVAVAAALGIVVAGLGGLLLVRGDGTPAPTGQLATADIASALEFAMHDEATTTEVGPTTEIAVPGVPEFYLYGSDVPPPPEGSVYRLWVVSSSETRYLGDFLPHPDGTLVLHVALDPTAWDRLLVTVEPVGSTPSTPGQPAW